MKTLLVLLLLASPIIFIIYAIKEYKYFKAGKKIEGPEGVAFVVSGLLTVFLLIVVLSPFDDTTTTSNNNYTEDSTIEEYTDESDKEEEEPIEEEPVKLDPIDTSNIYVYVSFYNRDEVFGNCAHEDYNCVFCKKKVFGDPLNVMEVNAKELAESDSKYEHVTFCPYCSHYSDYYLNGDPNK